MTPSRTSFAAALLGLSFAVPAVVPAMGAEETTTIQAFAVLEASGTMLDVGPDTNSFAGSISGPYFVDTGQGPVPAGRVTCTGTLDAEIATGRQTANGRCRFVAFDGAVAFGRFECEGFRLVGCSGPFAITGGEERLAGVTGEGTIVLRRYETELSVNEDGVIHEAALGIASWRDLRITLPEAR
jgi:hypothetical protein